MAAAGDVVVVAIANEGRVVRVAGPGDAAQALVVLAARVGVLDDGREGGAAGVAADQAAQDARVVGLLARRGGVAAAGRSAVKECLQLVEVNLEACRQALDGAANGV